MKPLMLTQKLIDNLESYGFVCSDGETLYGFAAVSKYVYTYYHETPFKASIGFGRAMLSRMIKEYGNLTVSEFRQAFSFSS